MITVYFIQVLAMTIDLLKIAAAAAVARRDRPGAVVMHGFARSSRGLNCWLRCRASSPRCRGADLTSPAARDRYGAELVANG